MSVSGPAQDVSHAAAWHLPHRFDEGNPAAERSTRLVLGITLLMMVAEIIGGLYSNSMALLADGWHMSSHAVAIGMAALAYALARRHAHDTRYAWGTWKIEVLGGFVSALLLLLVAAAMLWGSVERLFAPLAIHYTEAIWIAVIGLVVNLVCAALLHGAHDHDHGHGHSHDHALAHDDHDHDDHDHDHDHDDHDDHAHAHHGEDVNLRSAYVHVLADAATSLLAIAALLGGSWLGWWWLDSVIGMVGAVVVAVWALGLLRETGAVLLDHERHLPVGERVRARVLDTANGGDIEISDLHVWRVGRSRYACVLGLVTHRAELQPDDVRGWLRSLPELYHVNVEINRCSACR
ncbi:CDF family Co(II)/Ni(II) efflux transporter DmeF [Uliginosibacterium sediminicola]|uniref:CDF family Co(II)/Ni(II) efflux transporter DmeF n=1 Tax=Uliginosibacterium sediminicola TaxID=2024550 RepID=A0ABU9YXX6_9RHOO